MRNSLAKQIKKISTNRQQYQMYKHFYTHDLNGFTKMKFREMLIDKLNEKILKKV